MRMSGLLAACVFALGGWVHAAHAADAVERATAQVQAAQLSAYRAELARFDTAQSVAPADVALGVAKCKFIARYTDEEYEWIETAPVDLDTCRAGLRKRWPKAPEVALFEIGNDWDDDALARARTLLDGEARSWPVPMRAELLGLLSALSDGDEEGAYALQQAELGDPEHIAKAVEYLAGRRRFDEAERLLRKAPPASEDWQATGRIRAALQLPDVQVAFREAERHRKAGIEATGMQFARAYLRAGHPAEAKRAVADITAKNKTMRQLHFDIAMAQRDWPAAVATIDIGDTEDGMATFSRFAHLAAAAPQTLLSGQMPLFVFLVLVLAVALAFVPAVLVVPVHYRGLVRRLQHRVSVPTFPGINLWHAWFGAAVALVVPTMLSLFMAPSLEGELQGAKMLRLMLWATLAGIVCLVPVLGVFGKRGVLGDAALWRANAKRIVGYWLILVAINYAMGFFYYVVGADTTTEQVKMVAALAEQASGSTGVLLTLGVVAVIGPIFEELTFRGLLLGGLSRHLDWRWANGVQAFLFACMHADPPRFPFYFLMGLFGGWLVRRTGSLAPAIALHMLNNAVAIGVMMAVM
jgi:membrane protease YdiL (CAAX protease family)